MSSSIDKTIKILQGHHDARSLRGRMARGNNVYKGTSQAAHRGGGVQFGRPKKAAIARRLNKSV